MTVSHLTFISTVQPRFADHTASPSLGDATTQLKGWLPSRTTDARNFSLFTSHSITGISAPGCSFLASSRPVPGSAIFALSPPLTSGGPDCSKSLKHFHTSTAAGHRGDSVTSDSTRASATRAGLDSLSVSVSGLWSDSNGVGFSSGTRWESLPGTAGSTMSRLEACATRANKPCNKHQHEQYGEVSS